MIPKECKRLAEANSLTAEVAKVQTYWPKVNARKGSTMACEDKTLCGLSHSGEEP